MGTVQTLRPKAKGGKCPMCGKAVVAEFRPFCSRRCANLDLGRWLDGTYTIPGEPVTPETSDDTDKDGGES